MTTKNDQPTAPTGDKLELLALRDRVKHYEQSIEWLKHDRREVTKTLERMIDAVSFVKPKDALSKVYLGAIRKSAKAALTYFEPGEYAETDEPQESEAT